MADRINIAPINIIVAVDEAGGFGKDGKIPWNFPEDMAHFKKVTQNSVCIMGRKTYQDMLEMRLNDTSLDKITEILPKRTSFVVTENKTLETPGATKVPSIRKAVQSLKEDDKRNIFVIGGSKMFIEAMAWVDTLYMTIIEGNYKCDVFFPISIINRNFYIQAAEKKNNLSFVTYRRKNT